MTKEERILLKLIGLFFFAYSLAGVFLNIFLFKLGGFIAVTQYWLISLIFLLLIYILSGYFLKKYSSKLLIRAGLLGLSILYLLLLFFRENSINHLGLLGLVHGIALGCYWSGYNLTQYISTHEHSRNEYFGKLNFFLNIGQSAGPIIGGLIIYTSGIYSLKMVGYFTLFSIVSLLFFAIFLLTKRLSGHKGSEFFFLEIIKHKRDFSWRIVLSQQFLSGLIDISFQAFSSILMFQFLKEELTLGIVNTISTAVYALANILAIRILKSRKSAYIFGMIFSPVALFIFALQQNWLGIASLILINNLTLPLLNITTSKAIYDAIDSVKEPWQRKYHFLIERDVALGFARILVYAGLLLFFTPENQISVAKTWIFIVPLIPFLIGLLQLYKDYSSRKVVLKP